MKEAVTRLDYCQYLLASPIDYLLTNFADHSESFSHDQVNQYLGGEKVTPRLVWENVTSDVGPQRATWCLMTRCSTNAIRLGLSRCGGSTAAMLTA